MTDLSKLSDAELKNEARRLSFDIAKYHNYQLTKKVQLNSAYGAMGNQYFRFYDIRLAEAVTLSGQMVIQWLARDLNAYLNNLLKSDSVDYVIASDTDSIYITLDALVKQVYKKVPDDKVKVVDLLDKFSEEKLQAVIDKSAKNIKEYFNSFAQKMVMKRESIADKAIWTAKKRYMMNVFDSEGVRYETPKLKIQGIEAIKSSTPEVCRQKIKDAVKIIMTKTQSDLHKYIADFKKEFQTLPPETVAAPRGLNTFDKEQTKGMSIHAKGAVVYNELLKKHKLTKKYPQIEEGDKVRFLYLKLPNHMHSHVISLTEEGLPKELNVDKYIDYNVQFEKTFLDPLRIILEAINWTTEKVYTLDDIFED